MVVEERIFSLIRSITVLVVIYLLLGDRHQTEAREKEREARACLQKCLPEAAC